MVIFSNMLIFLVLILLMQIQVLLSEPSRVLGNQDGSDTQMFVPASLLFKVYPDDKSMVVNDSRREPIYSVESCNTATHCKREVSQIVCGVKHPSLLLQKQIATLHARCGGYSTSLDNIRTYGQKLFSVSKNDILQNHTDLNVKLLYTFLDNGASPEPEEHGALLNDLLENDSYKIVGSWSKKSLNIYKPGSSTVIAKVSPLDTNDRFMVEVSSNVDCAFVVSLIAAVDCMKDPGTLKHAGRAIGFVLKAATGGAIVAADQALYGLFSS